MRGEQKTMSVERVCALIRQGRIRIPPYQRQFVWDKEQQRLLIDSIRKELYIGQMILAQTDTADVFDVIDGQQRLRTVFSFVQNQFLTDSDGTRLTPLEQDHFLGQPLHFYILHRPDAEQIAELFSSINHRGERLTVQELRRVDESGSFARAVNDLATHLYPLPAPSFTEEDDLAYASCLWSRWHLFSQKELRQGAERDWLAGVLFCVLFGGHQRPESHVIDRLYEPDSALFREAEGLLEQDEAALPCLKEVLSLLARPAAPPEALSKEGFHVLTLALYRLLRQGDHTVTNIRGLTETAASLALILPDPLVGEERYRALEEYTSVRLERLCLSVVDRDDPDRDGLTAALRRARVETAGYEFKQGLLRLSEDRKQDACVGDHIVKTLCGMANANLGETGYLFIGIADKETDARRIERLDGIHPLQVEQHFVVGVDREAARMGLSMDGYCRVIKEIIDRSLLSDALRLSVLSHIDVLSYGGFSVIRLSVPPQKEVALLGDRLYVRKHSHTIPVTAAREIIAVANQFRP